jgi:hypothetical protein
MRSLNVKFVGSIALAMTVAASEAPADTVFYTDQSAFDAAIGTSITDTYASPGYTSSMSNSQMNKVFGETRYTTTGFRNNNMVSNGISVSAPPASRIVAGAMARLLLISRTRILVLPKAFTESALSSSIMARHNTPRLSRLETSLQSTSFCRLNFNRKLVSLV